MLVVLLFLDLITEAAFSGLFNFNLARLIAQRERMEKPVNRVLELTRSPRHLRAALSLLQLLLRLFIAGLILALFPLTAEWGWRVLESAGILALAAMALFWLEWIVGALALRNPELWAIRLALYARFWIVVLSPFLVLPLALSHNPKEAGDSTGVTEDELKSLVDASEEEGVLEEGEREMIYSIFQLGDTLVREIMVPRIDMQALDVTTPLPQAADAMLQSGHSRVPVYEETVDQIMGLLYARDLLRIWREGHSTDSLRDLLRPACFIPEAKKVDELLEEMQADRIHMAIVVDEYGGVAGLITLEDIVEEIVGEIQDEYDQSEELPYQLVKNGEYIFQGRVDLGSFNELMGSHLVSEEAETLGGYIYSSLGRVPINGETVLVAGLLLTVEQVSGRRIRKVRAQWAPLAAKSGEDNQNVDS